MENRIEQIERRISALERGSWLPYRAFSEKYAVGRKRLNTLIRAGKVEVQGVSGCRWYRWN